MFRLFPKSKHVNLVLGGGGAKGVGLVGAMAALEESGYTFDCIAGCSIGAVAGAFKAAGLEAPKLRDMVNEIEFTAMLDNPLAEKLGPIAKGVSVMTRRGVHSGEKFHEWAGDVLSGLGVTTFGDLKMPNAHRYPPGYGYRLVVIAADITHGKLVRLPWDYPAMGLDPDKQKVADALRAATSLPFIFRPYELGGSLLVDGGLVTSYPIGIFNTLDFRFSKRETIGVQLSLRPELKELNGADGPLATAKAMLITAMNIQNDATFTDPRIRKNTIFVDTADVRVTDFGLTKEQLGMLYDNGYAAAQEFIKARG